MGSLNWKISNTRDGRLAEAQSDNIYIYVHETVYGPMYSIYIKIDTEDKGVERLMINSGTFKGITFQSAIEQVIEIAQKLIGEISDKLASDVNSLNAPKDVNKSLRSRKRQYRKLKLTARTKKLIAQ